MDKLINKNLISKIQERAVKNLRIEAVYLNSNLETKTIEYLKKQRYLEFSKIEIILKSIFIKSYPLGYALIDKNGNVVGFLGTIFSIRNEHNKEYIFCNIHTWIVDEKYRLNAFLLLTDLLDKNYTLTAFTPVKSLVGLLEKFGFEKIKMKYRIIFLFSFIKLFRKNNYKIETNNLIIEKFLNKKDLSYYNSYLNIPCKKFIIINENDKNKYIFVIATKVKKKKIQTLNLVYVSDSMRLKNNWNSISSKISSKFNVSFCVQNFFNEFECSIPKKIMFTKDIQKNVCIKNLKKEFNLDILYSDLIE